MNLTGVKRKVNNKEYWKTVVNQPLDCPEERRRLSVCHIAIRLLECVFLPYLYHTYLCASTKNLYNLRKINIFEYFIIIYPAILNKCVYNIDMSFLLYMFHIVFVHCYVKTKRNNCYTFQKIQKVKELQKLCREHGEL